MKTFREFSDVNENVKIGDLKLPEYANHFVDEIASAAMDPAIIVAEVIGLISEFPEWDDFLPNLKDELKARKIKI